MTGDPRERSPDDSSEEPTPSSWRSWPGLASSSSPTIRPRGASQGERPTDPEESNANARSRRDRRQLGHRILTGRRAGPRYTGGAFPGGT